MIKLVAPNLSDYKAKSLIYKIIIYNLSYYVSCKLTMTELYGFIYTRLSTDITKLDLTSFVNSTTITTVDSINKNISEKIIGLDKFDWICQNIKKSNETRIEFIDENGNKFQGLINNEKYEKIHSLLFGDCN